MKNVAARTRIERALARLDAARREYQDAIAAAPDGIDDMLSSGIVHAAAEDTTDGYRLSCDLVVSKVDFPALVRHSEAYENALTKPRATREREQSKVRNRILVIIRDHLDGLRADVT